MAETRTKGSQVGTIVSEGDGGDDAEKLNKGQGGGGCLGNH